MLASPKGGATCLTTPPIKIERSERFGGGGSRTRVRESFVVGLYMRSRP
jgi:hypothetical protein